jgi:hypothetical protein
MNDDWRVQVTCPTSRTADALSEQLRAGTIEHELEGAAGARVIVSVEDHELFLYAGSQDQAERAADAVRRLAATSSATVEVAIKRWHSVAEEWVDADQPLPDTPAENAEEHEETIEREREESAAMHVSEYEVCVHTRSHRDTVALAEALKAEGIPSLRRWRYLLVGAPDEDAAKALAARISALTPVGSKVEVEASYAAVQAETPSNPFAVFGGLGG